MLPRLVVAGLMLIAAVTAAVAQTPTTVRVGGVIERFDGQVLALKPSDGQAVAVRLASDYAVMAAGKGDLANITPGMFVGAGGLPQPDGTITAVRLVVFPDSMRGTGEGHRPWSMLPQSTMTNATVADVVTRSEGRLITLKYKDGEQRLRVAPDATIILLTQGERSMLKPGTHVTLTARREADGALVASRVTAGRDGFVPPL
ncbi:MAG: hypothetical protein ACT4P2_13385 [Pseudomonadota bacterium]